MPLFQIRREVPGATQEEMDAGALRALMCAMEFPNMRWVQSQWDIEGGVEFCIFEANSSDEIWEHSRRARIPCNDVREIRMIYPENFLALLASRESLKDANEAPPASIVVETLAAPLTDN